MTLRFNPRISESGSGLAGVHACDAVQDLTLGRMHVRRGPSVQSRISELGSGLAGVHSRDAVQDLTLGKGYARAVEGVERW